MNLVIYLKKEKVTPKTSAENSKKLADIILDYKDIDQIFTKKIDDIKDLTFSINKKDLSCFKIHILGEILGINLSLLGEKLNKEKVKIIDCQLGCF